MTAVDGTAGTAPESGQWPRTRSSALDWFMANQAQQPFIDNLFGELCHRLEQEGLPLARTTMHMRTLHPQLFGGSIVWRRGSTETQLTLHERSAVLSDTYLNSPIRALYDGAEGIRRRLGGPGENYEYGIYADLAAEGMTDYVAMPLVGSDGRRHACSWATDRPDGFTTDELRRIDDFLPVLQMATEIRMTRRMAKNILSTYVGKDAGERVLAGDITRGAGGSIEAALWTCDLRGFTTISESWPRDDVLAWLNDYFDAMAEPVEKRGGEILKFIGDAMLAIFRLDRPNALRSALDAAREAAVNMQALNKLRVGMDKPELAYGLALHVGEVMYGNIGSKSRLDFTVIGPAVNEVARLEKLTRVLDRTILVSGAFANVCDDDCLIPLGEHELRGVGRRVEVFALREPTI